jgi:hypothetical protein
MKKLIALSILPFLIFSSCKKKSDSTSSSSSSSSSNTTAPRLVFKFKFDSTQIRLNNIGQTVSGLPAGHKAQSPRFNGMGAHYIEMAQSDYTALGGGAVLYSTPTVPTAPVTVTSGTTSITYTNAIDFDQQPVKGQGEEFYSVPLSQVAHGTYKWLRISLVYQNYDITYKYTYQGTPYFFTGTIASFIGFQTHINSYKIKTQTLAVNADKMQGYWGFETTPNIMGVSTTTTSTGQAPSGATTVVNPLFSTSAIPPGSCLVTGQFVNSTGTSQSLTITGNETKDIVVIVSLSVNQSFEWNEVSGDSYYEPAAGDAVVDMGVRGMIPFIQP